MLRVVSPSLYSCSQSILTSLRRRLTDLDLSNNKITSVQGLDFLPVLTLLTLGITLPTARLSYQLMLSDNNSISTFPAPSDGPVPTLTTLSLRSNKLITIDLSAFAPHVKFLHLDGNALTSLPGLEALASLDTLTLGSQNLPPDAQAPLEQLPDLPNLDLSNNALPALAVTNPLTNLRHLNLSSCSLASLPSDFGAQLPALRSLNLNYNGLKDLRPLLNMRVLRSLSVVGNRLARLRKNVAVLRLLVGLETVDLRGNPFTVGFYNPGVMREVALRADNKTPRERKDEGLPVQNREVDRDYVARLDEDTRLRRRVYEMLCVSSCAKLRMLDGLEVRKRDVLVKDEIWKRLVELRVVKKSEG